VAFSPTGQLLASGGLDGRVCVWQVVSHALIYVFSGQSAVLSIAWLEDSEQLVCRMQDGTIAHLVILASSIKLEGFWAHPYPVERLAYSHNQLASGAHGEVKIWLRASGSSWTFQTSLSPPRPSSYTTAHEIVLTSLHWTSAPSHPSVLLATYMSHGIVAFDAQTGARIGAAHVPGRIADACLSRDGRLLVVSNMLTGFELFELKGLVEIEALYCFKQKIQARMPLPVRFLHGDHAIIGGTSDGRINIWDV
ncbi:WD40-repeat-containing domain protein, partial [Dichomitus squalens]